MMKALICKCKTEGKTDGYVERRCIMIEPNGNSARALRLIWDGNGGEYVVHCEGEPGDINWRPIDPSSDWESLPLPFEEAVEYYKCNKDLWSCTPDGPIREFNVKITVNRK